jgi:CheY-like chemotaxis protein
MSLERERAARAEADAASRAKDEFVAILSHELRNPLASISAAAAALDASDEAREGSALVAVIRRQARHLARLIDDLLDIAGMAANKLILRKEPLDLGEAARSCVTALLAARGVPAARIELELSSVWVDADPVRVAQIVENLVGNALKHTPSGKRIRVSVCRLGDVAELSVEDEGFGIRPELLPKVFEPFTQGAQGLERTAGGLGLGLTLVRRLVELHGGTAEAQSAGVDRGSTFVLRFPSRSEPQRASAAKGDRRAPSDRPRRLLVIEDNADARQTLRALLEALGHEVHEAGDGEAGIAAATNFRPDLAFVDIGLPRLDGYEVARRLRAANMTVRLVALTGYGRDEEVRRAREAGFDEHILKPANVEQLRAAIAATTGASA